MTQILKLLSRINQDRSTRNLQPLRLNPVLSKVALSHSIYMQKNEELTHCGELDTSFADRINAGGYFFAEAAENIALSTKKADDTFDLWMESENHRGNILNPAFSDFGAGLVSTLPQNRNSANYYWTLLLACPLHFEDEESVSRSISEGV